jgi:hypothetical protein
LLSPNLTAASGAILSVPASSRAPGARSGYDLMKSQGFRITSVAYDFEAAFQNALRLFTYASTFAVRAKSEA